MTWPLLVRSIKKLKEVINKLIEEIIEVRLKEARLLKQRRFHFRKLKDIDNKEAKNILELEEDERREEEAEKAINSLINYPAPNSFKGLLIIDPVFLFI